jgi:hypothetical protein
MPKLVELHGLDLNVIMRLGLCVRIKDMHGLNVLSSFRCS